MRARKPDTFESHPTLPGVDMRTRMQELVPAWEVDFTKKPVGYVAGREMSVKSCPRCGHNGLERMGEDGVKVWEHLREYYVHSTGRTSSRVVSRCRE